MEIKQYNTYIFEGKRAATTSPFKGKVEEVTDTTYLVTNLDTNCTSEAVFDLYVDFKPMAFDLPDLIGCDENGDGISEYFDISNIESTILGNQSGMDVSYFDSKGNNIIPTNPFTNTVPFQEVLTVRLTHPFTQCFAETKLILKTSSKPQINTPKDVYACDEGGGTSTFNLSSIENDIVGNQNNLRVYYYDVLGNEITNSITSNFQNTEAWSQTIYVKVENALSNLCVSETRFNVIVNELPEVDIENEYFLCNLEPSLEIEVNSNFESYVWSFEDGTVISNNYNVTLINSGNYTLKVDEIKNSIICENIYNFKLIRSVLPTIEEVKFKEFSDENFIKIVASGDGDFEYSIDGSSYQDSNLFDNVLGGIYMVYVRDKFGCGQDSQEVTIIDYPKYFTPNNDGVNDTWQIKGIIGFPKALIYIYDRYGKLLKQISPKGNGWNGFFNGSKMLPADYWFTVSLEDKRSFTGHFTLKL